nr:hypothetical protein [Tanacetum cinerariifolium]
DPAQRRKTPLVLPWERIPRLDSGVRIRVFVFRDYAVGAAVAIVLTTDPAQRRKTPLVLPWERIPRLDSGVRIRVFVFRDYAVGAVVAIVLTTY